MCNSSHGAYRLEIISACSESISAVGGKAVWPRETTIATVQLRVHNTELLLQLIFKEIVTDSCNQLNGKEFRCATRYPLRTRALESFCFLCYQPQKVSIQEYLYQVLLTQGFIQLSIKVAALDISFILAILQHYHYSYSVVALWTVVKIRQSVR